MHPRILAALLIFLTTMTFHPHSVHAQQEVVRSWVDYDFGKQITFNTEIKSSAPIKTAILFFQAHGDTHTSVGLGSVEKIKDDLYRLSYTHPLEDYRLRSFSRVDYRWEIATDENEKQQLATNSFDYIDNRYRWNSLEEKPFKVYWFDETGDVEFAQAVIDAAQAGYKKADDLLPLTKPNNSLDIYVYPDSESMQEVLHTNTEDWVAGHADADLGVIVVTLPPGPDQKLLIDQRVPHELMHVLLFQFTDPGYANLPTWLNEGLASQVELYPNSDYPILLEEAVKRQTLIPMVSLCQTFPRDASNALLSYAQAASFTKYLYNTYGTTGLVDLVKAYANGLDCQRGAQHALGLNLTQLERGWRSDVLAIDVVQSAVNNLLPWVILLLAVLAVPAFIAIRHLRYRPNPRPAEQRNS
jgi:Peptidase MA superfamily